MSKKFMMQMDTQTYRILEKLSRRRHIGVQELLRAVTIPEWLDSEKKRKSVSST
jgi:hypothetical protein